MLSARVLLSCLAAAALTYAQNRSEYDYIICGGGTAGLVLANRLSEENNTVLVVEAGIDGNTQFWGYQTTPQAYLNGRVLDLPAGKTTGGSSQVNGRVYSRPERDSIDDWGRVNNANWSWETLFPFYKSSESLARPRVSGYTPNPNYHGTAGPVNVTYPAQDTPAYFEILRSTAAAFDIPVTRDFNGGRAEGLSRYPATVRIEGEREQLRESSREAYLLPIVGRPNLEILDGTECLRLVFGPKTEPGALLTATGVEIANDDSQKNISATKEVIITAGVYRSPGILEYSGIGNKKLLANYSIETNIDLPGVGENLQDQMQGDIFWQRAGNTNISFPASINGEITTPFIIHATYEQIFGSEAGAFQQRTQSSLASYAEQISARIGRALSAEQILKSLQVQYEAVYERNIPAVEIFSGQMLNTTHLNLEFWPLIPLGRGSCHISGRNAERAGDHPLVDVNWGILDHDWDIFIASARFVRKMFQTGQLAAEVTVETRPGFSSVPMDASDDDWKAFWIENFRAGWHGVGTCAMLPREWGGVVDGDLKVYGTANVRVADASALPLELGGHPSSTMYAFAERAALIIRDGLKG